MGHLKFNIVAGLLALACLAGLSSYLPDRFSSGEAVDVTTFPMKIGPWTARDVPLTQRDYDILETRNLIMREYTDPRGRAVLFYIVYSGDNRKVLHPPEVCYLGSGATISEKGMIELSSGIQANKMVLEMGAGRQLVVYWYRAGTFNTPQYFSQQLKVMLGRLLMKKTSSAMVRVSASNSEGDDAGALTVIQDFIVDVEPILNKYVP